VSDLRLRHVLLLLGDEAVNRRAQNKFLLFGSKPGFGLFDSFLRCVDLTYFDLSQPICHNLDSSSWQANASRVHHGSGNATRKILRHPSK
jgi:hypothetical protein